jgi:O-antigen ligase
LRYLLALLIFFFTTVDMFGWSLSLAPGLSVKNALLYLIMLSLASRYVVRGGFRLEVPKVYFWYGLLIAYATLTCLIASTIIQYQSYDLLLSVIALKGNLIDGAIIFTLYLYGTRTYRDAEFLLKCALLAVGVANAIAIGNVAGLFQIGATPVGNEGNITSRVFGAFGHANETAALIVYLLPAYMAATLSAGGIVRVLCAFAGIASAALLVLTGSRSGVVAFVLAGVFGSLLCRNLISWRRATGIAVALVVAGVAVLALVSLKFGDVLTQRMLELIVNPGHSGEDRTAIWIPLIDMMTASPVTLFTGFGWNVYSIMGFLYAPHNTYLQMWFELGIIGVVSYVMMLSQLTLTARRAAASTSGAPQAYLIAYVYGIVGLSIALFAGQLYSPLPYVWIYGGLSMRMAVLALQSAKPAPASRVRKPRQKALAVS